MLASSELSKDHISDRGRNAEADDVSRVCRLTRAVRPPGITCRGGGGLQQWPNYGTGGFFSVRQSFHTATGTWTAK